MQKKNQRGNLIMMLVPIVTVLLLVAISGTFWVISHQKKPTKTETSSVSADDVLTSGNTNADLSQDVRILSAGLSRDNGYISSTNTALNDQPQPVLND
jgi:flagellar basal body-associated protein FliL